MISWLSSAYKVEAVKDLALWSTHIFVSCPTSFQSLSLLYTRNNQYHDIVAQLSPPTCTYWRIHYDHRVSVASLSSFHTHKTEHYWINEQNHTQKCPNLRKSSLLQTIRTLSFYICQNSNHHPRKHIFIQFYICIYL